MLVRTQLRILVIACLSFALGGCRDQDPQGSISGAWIGVADGRTITLLLTDNEGEISGRGQITDPSGTLSITGTRSDAEISIEMLIRSPNGVLNSASIYGERRSWTIVGTVSGAVFDDEPIVLKRWDPFTN